MKGREREKKGRERGGRKKAREENTSLQQIGIQQFFPKPKPAQQKNFVKITRYLIKKGGVTANTRGGFTRNSAPLWARGQDAFLVI